MRYSNFGLMYSEMDDIGSLDFVLAGIWAGIFYGLAGLLGLFGSYERKRSQWVETVEAKSFIACVHTAVVQH